MKNSIIRYCPLRVIPRETIFDWLSRKARDRSGALMPYLNVTYVNLVNDILTTHDS